MRRVNKLSARKVETLTAPGLYADGLNVWLRVAPSGSKSWAFRFMLRGRARSMGLGPVHTVTLQQARELALGARRLLIEGHDPIEARRHGRGDSPSFQSCAERYIEAHRSGWRNAKHADQWLATLTTYVFPKFGDLPVHAVDVGLVLEALEPIWNDKPETASRVRGRIESILDWAGARGYRHGPNPATWRGHLDKLLSGRRRVREVKHHPALPYAEIPTFMAQLREREGFAARALEITILTACRTGEVIGAKWDEIDLAAKVWTVPATRTKSARPHRVPLSDRAIDVLSALPQEGEHVFPGAKLGKPLSNMALLAVMKRMNRGDLTVHGFRSSFRDWTAEQTNYPRDVAEMALAHIVKDRAEAAYRRGDLIDHGVG